MPGAHQRIDPDLMEQVRACLVWRRAQRIKVNGKRLMTADVLNEIIALGLEKYADLYQIPLPRIVTKEEK